MSGVSQNGYSFGDSSVIATYTVVRDVKVSLRKGDASIVLLHWLRWYDKNIEPLTKADTGGYNPRTVAGSKVKSNHGSGTATDHRWNKRPRGKRTYTTAQRTKIRNQIKFYEGVLRWGGDYVNATVDEMHVEVNKGPSELARIANKCKGDSSAPSKPSTPGKPAQLSVDGKLGPKTITRWQQVMKTPVDGKISSPVSDLVKAVQTKLRATVDHRLVVDGKLGPKTIGRLQTYLKTPVDQKISTPVSQVIKALQRRLNEGRF